MFGKDSPVPQWGLDAAKTPTPSYAGDAASVILYDEYLESVDDQGRAVERERYAIRILKPQGRDASCEISYDVDEKVNYFREWTLTADGKTFQAKDTDFADLGDTSVPVDAVYRAQRAWCTLRRPTWARPSSASRRNCSNPTSRKRTGIFNTPCLWCTRLSRLTFPRTVAHTEAWHNQAPVKAVEVAPSQWRWEIKDERALNLRDVPSRPAWEALAARMTVLWGNAAVDGKENQWRAIGQWFTTLEAGPARTLP